MATIGKFTGGVNTPSTITETNLTGTDTFVYIRDFLKGTIAVTGGVAGVFAYILK